ncbi:hypothetical protein EV426DRAFT_252225 [Tirmania nivea]|nr:hypothetical protein EV426DRAFT_252225 [Tirmania nivea]
MLLISFDKCLFSFSGLFSRVVSLPKMDWELPGLVKLEYFMRVIKSILLLLCLKRICWGFRSSLGNFMKSLLLTYYKYESCKRPNFIFLFRSENSL